MTAQSIQDGEAKYEQVKVAVVYYSSTGLGGLWMQGQLADKVYSGFTATSTAHGGQESTILALYNTVHHFGGIVVAPGYTDPIKFVDGNPYGTSHLAGQRDLPIIDTTRQAAAYQGARVVKVAADLKAGRENARQLIDVGGGA
jgi:NAD(P)H dehydrogenase (quinone)